MKLYMLLENFKIFSHCHIVKPVANKHTIIIKNILRNFPNASYDAKTL